MFTLPNKGEGFNDVQSVLFREHIEILVDGISGINCVVSGGLVSAQGSANMTVAVQAAVVRSGDVEMNISANASVPITTANNTFGRFDLVVINSAGAIIVRAGTPAAEPKPPAREANDVALAVIYVPAGATNIGATQIVDMRVPMQSIPNPDNVTDGNKGVISIAAGVWGYNDNSITEAKLSLSDVATGNANTSRHGFLPKLSNIATEFLNGQGQWATPSGGGGGSAGTLDQTLTLGNESDLYTIFDHTPPQNIIRIVNPNNVGESYQYGGAGPFYGAGAWSETILRIDGVNASGRPNYVYMRGYNQNGGGGVTDPTEAGMHEAMEFNWEAGGIRKFEWHWQVKGTNGVTARVGSYEINKENAVGVLFHEINQFLLKRTPTTVGGPAADYAVIGEAGIDLINADPGETLSLRMYTEAAANGFIIQSGNAQTIIKNLVAGWDMAISTPRTLQFSNRIKFTGEAEASTGVGHVTIDTHSNKAGKSLWFRNAAEDTLLELLDGATFTTMKPGGLVQLMAGTTSYPSMRMPAGVAPTSPTNGDFWHEGNNIWARLNGVSVKLNDPYTNPILGSGAGTTGTIPKYTANYTLANSIMAEASGQINITGRASVSDQFYLGPLASDPATNLANGAMYYNTTSGKGRIREGGAWVNMITSAGSAVVTSVALAMPSGFSVANSPITTSGTLNVTTTLNGVLVGNGSGFAVAADNAIPVAKLTAGSNGQYLTVVGGVTTWGSLSGGGDVVGPASSVNDEIVLFNSTTGKLIKRASGTGFVKSTSGVASFQASILTGDITSLEYTKVNNFATASLAGRTTAATGALEAITVNSTLSLSALVLGVNEANLTHANIGGNVPGAKGGLPTGGTTGQILSKIDANNYNATWVTPGVYVTDGDKADINVSSSGTLWAIRAGRVNTTMLASQANNTILANLSGSAGSPSAVTTSALTAALDIFTLTLKGLVPPPTTSTGKYLRDDGTWVIPSGAVSSVSGTTNRIVASPTTGAVVLDIGTDVVTLTGSQTLTNKSIAATQITGQLGIANGGTGQATANAALNALLPTQTGQSGKVLQSNGTDVSWQSAGSGAPGGSSGQIQFNDAGGFNGASKMEVSAEGQLILIDTTGTPTTPAAGMLVFNGTRAGRRLLYTMGPSGLDQPYQPAFFTNRIARFSAFGASQTTVFQDNIGTTAYVAGVAAANATTNLRTSLMRINYPTTAAVNISGGVRGTTAPFWRGNASNRGGFFAVFRFGFNAFNSANRIFIGFNNTTGAISATSDPSALLQMCGLIKNVADTNMFFAHNDGAGAAVKSDTGMAPNTTDFWEFRMFCAPNDTVIYFWLKNLATNATVSYTSPTTDLPTNTTFLAPHMVINTGTSATLASMDVQSMYFETDN